MQTLASVRYTRVANIHVDGKVHTFTKVGLPAGTEMVAITPSELGCGRLLALTPQPIGAPFGVAWDGSTSAPTLSFDNAPEGDFEVVVEAWGV